MSDTNNSSHTKRRALSLMSRFAATRTVKRQGSLKRHKDEDSGASDRSLTTAKPARKRLAVFAGGARQSRTTSRGVHAQQQQQQQQQGLPPARITTGSTESTMPATAATTTTAAGAPAMLSGTHTASTTAAPVTSVEPRSRSYSNTPPSHAHAPNLTWRPRKGSSGSQASCLSNTENTPKFSNSSSIPSSTSNLSTCEELRAILASIQQQQSRHPDQKPVRRSVSSVSVFTATTSASTTPRTRNPATNSPLLRQVLTAKIQNAGSDCLSPASFSVLCRIFDHMTEVGQSTVFTATLIEHLRSLNESLPAAQQQQQQQQQQRADHSVFLMQVLARLRLTAILKKQIQFHDLLVTFTESMFMTRAILRDLSWTCDDVLGIVLANIENDAVRHENRRLHNLQQQQHESTDQNVSPLPPTTTAALLRALPTHAIPALCLDATTATTNPPLASLDGTPTHGTPALLPSLSELHALIRTPVAEASPAPSSGERGAVSDHMLSVFTSLDSDHRGTVRCDRVCRAATALLHSRPSHETETFVSEVLKVFENNATAHTRLIRYHSLPASSTPNAIDYTLFATTLVRAVRRTRQILRNTNPDWDSRAILRAFAQSAASLSSE